MEMNIHASHYFSPFCVTDIANLSKNNNSMNILNVMRYVDFYS